MNKLLKIVLFTLLLPPVRINAQDKGSNVAIHTDPRLALLLNKAKTVENTDAPNTGAIKNGTSKKSKDKIPVGDAKKASSKTHPVAEINTERREPKYLYNPTEDEYPAPEKPTKHKPEGKSVAASKDDDAARENYRKQKATEKEIAANSKSTDEEIREYRESIEKERGSTKTTSKKIGRTGIAADEVRYLTPTVSGSSRGGRYNGTGYRVQIYYGTSREEAMRRKAEFMRHYPDVPTYFSYASPTYRVKVGDYRRREDAISMFREANGTYSPCMIVPDAVTIH